MPDTSPRETDARPTGARPTGTRDAAARPSAAGRDVAGRDVAGRDVAARENAANGPDLRGGRPHPVKRLTRVLGRASAGRFGQQRSRIEVGDDWRRCGAGDGGCGVLLPLGQPTCPRCGRTNREDLPPMDIRRLLAAHDAYGHALAVLRGSAAAQDAPTGRLAAPAPRPSERT